VVAAFLEAKDVGRAFGKLLVDDPKVKQALAGALKDYTDVYTTPGRTPTTTSPSTTRRRC